MPNDEMNPLDMDYQILQRIGPICDSFEAEFQRGIEPVIEVYLAMEMESDRSALLLELLKLDREYRVKLGSTLPSASYATRFQNDHHLLRSVFINAQTIATDSTMAPMPTHFGPLEFVAYTKSVVFEG